MANLQYWLTWLPRHTGCSGARPIFSTDWPGCHGTLGTVAHGQPSVLIDLAASAHWAQWLMANLQYWLTWLPRHTGRSGSWPTFSTDWPGCHGTLGTVAHGQPPVLIDLAATAHWVQWLMANLQYWLTWLPRHTGRSGSWPTSSTDWPGCHGTLGTVAHGQPPVLIDLAATAHWAQWLMANLQYWLTWLPRHTGRSGSRPTSSTDWPRCHGTLGAVARGQPTVLTD